MTVERSNRRLHLVVYTHADGKFSAKGLSLARECCNFCELRCRLCLSSSYLSHKHTFCRVHAPWLTDLTDDMLVKGVLVACNRSGHSSLCPLLQMRLLTFQSFVSSVADMFFRASQVILALFRTEIVRYALDLYPSCKVKGVCC